MFKIGQKVEISTKSWADFCTDFFKALPLDMRRFTDERLTVVARGYSAVDFYRMRKMIVVIEVTIWIF